MMTISRYARLYFLPTAFVASPFGRDGQVARLAGLPQSVVDRAKVVLEALEGAERAGAPRKALVDDLPLFRVQPATPPAPRGPRASAVEERLKTVHPDELSPKEALHLVYELRALLAQAQQ